MEVVGIIGSVAGIVSAADLAIRVSKKLYQIAKSARSSKVATEAEIFANQVRFFGLQISSTYNIIHEHSRNNQNSPIIKNIRKQNILYILRKQTNDLMRRIKKVDPQTKLDVGGLGLLERYLWVISKSERDELYVWMQRIQCMFIQLGFQVMFELLLKRARSSEDPLVASYNSKEELAKHQHIMMEHLEFMRDLREKHESINPESFKLIENNKSSGLRVVEICLKKLSRDVSTLDMSRTPLLPSLSSIAQSHSASRNLRSIPSPNRGDTLAKKSRVRPAALHWPQNLSTENITFEGYVNGINVIGIRNQGFPENLISETLVAELGLQIQPHQASSPPKEVVDGDRNREVTIGDVILKWSSDVVGNQPKTLMCYVCKQMPLPHDLVIGRRFLRRHQDESSTGLSSSRDSE